MPLSSNKAFDLNYFRSEEPPIGVDEVGRGPIAGPVLSCAVQVDPKVYFSSDYSSVYDSKGLTPRVRREIYEKAIRDPRIKYSIELLDHEVIDEINIYQATVRSMQKAIEKLYISKSVIILTDGLSLVFEGESTVKVIKGDQKSFVIALASIIAKESRDKLMVEYSQVFPQYGFESHKGYPTKKHKNALLEHGPCKIHRKSFAPVKEMV